MKRYSQSGRRWLPESLKHACSWAVVFHVKSSFKVWNVDLRQALNDRTYEWTFMVNRCWEKVERVNEFDKKMALDSNGGWPLPNEGRGVILLLGILISQFLTLISNLSNCPFFLPTASRRDKRYFFLFLRQFDWLIQNVHPNQRRGWRYICNYAW